MVVRETNWEHVMVRESIIFRVGAAHTAYLFRDGPVHFVQLEQGHFPTSYIPTGDGPRTRDADRISAAPGDVVAKCQRATEAHAVVNGAVYTWPPDSPRTIPGKGVLCEEARTNLYVRSVEPPVLTALELIPGVYALSWYGDGCIHIGSEEIFVLETREDNNP